MTKKSEPVLLAVLGLSFIGHYQISLASPADDVAKSHVEGNAPPPSQFDKILKRDLTPYFQKLKGKDTFIGYQYLRNGATQSGVSYPKYYL